MTKLLTGLSLGLMAGLGDCALFWAMGTPITFEMALGGVIFWMGVGLAIHAISLPFPYMIKGIALSLLFNIPWIIEYTIVQQQIDFLAPMVAVAIFWGLLIGISSKFLHVKMGKMENIA